MLSITEIEDLLKERIRAQLPYLAVVESFRGQVDFAREVPELVMRTPGVIVMLGGRKGEDGTYEDQNLALTWNLGVVVKNLRGEEEARRDPEGAYQILEDLWAALARCVLHDDLQPLSFVEEDLLWASKEFVMYGAKYSLTLEKDYEQP